MPIYEYQCDACAHRLEKLQKMSEDKLVDCPECGKPALRRLVSAVAFRLKGTGWYETDFKKDNKRNLAEDTSKEPSDKKSSDSNGKKPDSASSDSKDAKTPDKSTSKPAATPAAKESKRA